MIEATMNDEGNWTIETTMKAVREFPGWQDELNTPDDAFVIVCADGSVSCAADGDRIEESGFGGSESSEREWLEYWGFTSNKDTTFPRCVGTYRCTLYCADGVKACLARRPEEWNGLCPNQV